MMKYSVFYHHLFNAAQEKGCTVDEMMETVRGWGISYLELERDAIGTTEDDAVALLRQMEQHDLKPSSIYGFYDWGNNEPLPDENDLLIRQALAMGCPRIMVIPGFYSDVNNREKCAQQQQKMIAGTQRLVELANAQGLTVTIECFDNATSPISTIKGMAQFLEQVPGLMVTLETGNFYFSGDDILQAQQLFRNRVRHVHLKDRYVPSRVEGGAPAAMLTGDPVTSVQGEVLYPCAVGQGHIPVAQVLDELARWGYDGVMTIEHFGAGSYADAIRDSMTWLKSRETAE